MDSLIGQTIGNYQILALLGRGGTAEVYRARAISAGYLAALKVLRPPYTADPVQSARFAQEARILSRLRHPHIVHVYSADLSGAYPYIALQYLPGGTLKERLQRLRQSRQRLSLGQSVQLALAMASALGHAHRAGIAHRDVKPGNILFDETDRPLLTDFGILKELDGSGHQTESGSMVGTPAYMSPEQGMGQPGDARSDVYALGVLLFELTTGRLPFAAEKPLAVVLKHIHEPPPRPSELAPDLPSALEAVILKCLAKRPEERYQNGDELEAALWAAVQTADGRAEWARDVVRPAAATAAPAPTAEIDETATTLKLAAPTAPAHPAAAAADNNPDAPSGRRPMRRLATVAAAVGLIALLALAALWGGGYFGRAADGAPTAGLATTAPTTAVAQPTPPLPTPTPSVAAATPAATIAATATAMPTPAPTAACPLAVTLTAVFTYNPGVVAAPTAARFPLNWVVRNESACALPTGARLVYQGGDPLGQSGPALLSVDLAPGAAMTFSIPLISPAQPGYYTTSWQLLTADGAPLAPPWSVEVLVFEPLTGDG